MAAAMVWVMDVTECEKLAAQAAPTKLLSQKERLSEKPVAERAAAIGFRYL